MVSPTLVRFDIAAGSSISAGASVTPSLPAANTPGEQSMEVEWVEDRSSLEPLLPSAVDWRPAKEALPAEPPLDPAAC